MRYQHKFLNPFKVILTDDSVFQVNAGKVYNYYNPLNFSWAAYKKPDGEKLVQLSKEENNRQKISIDEQDISIEIYLMCSFKFPDFWVPGWYFPPDIAESWIVVRRKKSGGGNVYINDEESVLTVNPPNFSTLEVNNASNGGDMINILPAAPLCCIAKIIKKENGELELNQLLNSNFPVFSLLSYESYLRINQRGVFSGSEGIEDNKYPPNYISQFMEMDNITTDDDLTNRGGILSMKNTVSRMNRLSSGLNIEPFIHNQEMTP